LDDVDYLVTMITCSFIMHHASFHAFPIFIPPMHHIGSQDTVTPVAPEEPEGVHQQGAEEPELAVDEELEGDLPECPNHQPSSFLKGKPRSISPCGLPFQLTCVIYLFMVMH
jgi:hypothetical protein